MASSNKAWTETDRHEAISYGLRLREEMVAAIRVQMRDGNVKRPWK